MHVDIAMLADHPDHLDTVIGWHWREWSHGEPDASLPEWRDKLVSRSLPDRIPFTLVAFAEAEPVGCVTVCTDDTDARFADRGPWISGMLVIGDARNLGIGRALLRAAEARARGFGAAELWLWTTEASAFYRRCGYHVVSPKEGLRGRTVLQRDLAADAAPE
jgi:GNAT superfamily N-acetyltransferase